MNAYLNGIRTQWKRFAAWLGGEGIALLLVVGFVVHVGYAVAYRIPPTVDAKRYVTVAINLVERGVYCLECTVPLAADMAIHGVGPGYQFFLAGVFAMVGTQFWVVWMLQALMFVGVVAWIAHRTRAHASWQRNVFLGVLLFHPDIVQANAMLMTDTLFMAMVFAVCEACIWLLSQKGQRSSRWMVVAWTLIGGGFALANLIRPTGLPFFLLALAALTYLRLSWKHLALIVGGFILVQTPWVVRNYRVYDHFLLNSAVGGINLWVGLHPDGDGRYDLSRLPDVQEQMKKLTTADMELYSAEQARLLLTQHPIQSGIRFVQKGFGLFSLAKTSGYWFHYANRLDQGITALLSLLANTFLLAFGLAGLFLEAFRAWRARRAETEALLRAVLILACTAAPVLTVVSYRYRLPLLPTLVFFAIPYVLTRAKDRAWWGAGLASLTILFVGTVLDAASQWEKILLRISALF